MYSSIDLDQIKTTKRFYEDYFLNLYDISANFYRKCQILR